MQLYEGLVVGSVINFDVSNLFNLTFYSRTGILMLCFSFLLFYLANDIFLNVIRRLNIPDRHKVIIFCVIILIASFSTIIQHQLSGFYILTGLFIAIRAYTIWYNQGRLNATSFLLLLSICALISAIKLNYFQQLKEVPVRKALVHKLETADDPVANIALHHIEKKILSDPEALAYFNQKDHNDAYLRIYLKKKYFDGYLSKYDLKLHTYNAAGQTLTADTTYLLNAFRDLVAFTAFKVSSYFYHDDYFGRQSYFAILPVADNKKDLGTIVIELHSTPLEANITFPELLVNGEIMKDDNFKDYSYAYYVDNQLQNQGGQYPYKVRIASSDFSGQLKTYTTKLTGDINKAWYRPFAHYNHLVYKPDQRSTIVVTLYENTLGQIVTSVTFFFLNFLIFSGLVILLAAIWKRVRIYSVQNKQIKWGLRVNLDKVAYRTRIQFSVMATVVFTLLLIGIITIQSINIQYQEQQDKMIRDKLLSLANAFEDGLKKNYYSTTQEGQVRFNDFADSYRTDLTLFNRNGVKILTTQPKLYETGLTASRMNGRAFIIMGQQHQSLLLNKEKLGDLNFQAAYIPIKDTRGVTTAYLQLPYFDNETDYTNRTGALLNDMTNIYALVFVAVGLFAIIIARQITGPLQFIQLSISKTIYGQKNEPILWDRDDEIGALVKEYNKMISALEVSAQRLAQSERESAWREMAKQVAHEIKNPLTPLKLGLQLLDKAWKDKDPKFDQKFERFSKSFVEQIDSLSSIASEFSAFAKMPDTKMERVNLFDIINQAVIIFKQMDNVTITYTPGDAFYVNADRDQLMRCFNNLLKNAIEAMPLGKHALISISYKTEANNVLIMLTDNGNGIPDNLREKIFVPNFTTKSSGTGLGLAFVKNSIENTGGKVWFETETGKGTTFFISCPAAG